jgi:hypothetical protein
MGCGGSERVPGFLRRLGAAWWRGWVACWARSGAAGRYGRITAPYATWW